MKHLVLTFLALSDIARLRIFNIIVESGELCVCDIQRVMGFTQTKTSRHLACLKKAGLIKDRKAGLWVFYSVAKPNEKEKQVIIDCVIKLMKANEIARKDSKKLIQQIKSGCCETPKVLKSKCCLLKINKGKRHANRGN